MKKRLTRDLKELMPPRANTEPSNEFHMATADKTKVLLNSEVLHQTVSKTSSRNKATRRVSQTWTNISGNKSLNGYSQPSQKHILYQIHEAENCG